LAARPDVYELENRALDPDGLVLAAMRSLAPWSARTLVDLGCGSGYWLASYADEAALACAVAGAAPAVMTAASTTI
jgi:methylase of polypeptide subunit release factors